MSSPRIGLFAACAALFTTAAVAGPINLVTNGNFAITTDQTGGSCQLSYNCTSTGWSTPGGYNFIFLPNTATSAGAVGQYPGTLSLWGAANQGNNTWNGNSPTGTNTNFLAADGAFLVQPITQTITGLTIGDHYQLTFDWAGAQQTGYTSKTSEQWQVSLGSQTHSTAVLQNAAKGFTGWTSETFDYTATSKSEVLSFLALGTPAGQPPFSLLTGVTLDDIPAPGSSAVIVAGVIGLIAIRRKRQVASA